MGSTTTSAVRKRKEFGARVQKTKSTEVMACLANVTDAMHALLVRRADDLGGCIEGSAEEGELVAIVDIIEAYEKQRWPLGNVPSGKG